jgi:uncharacterized protein YacL (UPF0231 family)
MIHVSHWRTENLQRDHSMLHVISFRRASFRKRREELTWEIKKYIILLDLECTIVQVMSLKEQEDRRR